MRTEADDRATAQEPLEPPEPGGDKEGTPHSGASRGSVAPDTLTVDSGSRTMRESMPVVLSPSAPGWGPRGPGHGGSFPPSAVT